MKGHLVLLRQACSIYWLLIIIVVIIIILPKLMIINFSIYSLLLLCHCLFYGHTEHNLLSVS